MSTWNVTLSDETARLIEAHLGSGAGASGAVAAFVDDAVTRAVCQQTAEEILRKHPNLSATEAAEMAETVTGIKLGLEDVKAGRVRPAEEVFDEIAADLGLDLAP